MMKKICILFCTLLLLCDMAYARHIKGGLIQYEYVGPGSTSGTSIYNITVNVFRNCAQTGPMPGTLTIYDAVTKANVKQITNTTNLYSLESTPTKTTFDPCLSNPPIICYQIYTYTTQVTLTDNDNGYIIAVSDANRIAGIVNITNSSGTGITFTASIPAKLNGVDYHVNSSPAFSFKDTAIICYNSKFLYQFAASDKDGDRLTYTFDNGLNGTSTASIPPYYSLDYASGFSGISPLGPDVTIDTLTGLISGTAPSQNGEYVVAVYVHEWRNGVMFNSSKKELQIVVGDCSLSAVALKPVYVNCNNFVMSFQNESTASNITSYAWDFGVKNSTTDVSTDPTPSYTYADTGSYTVKVTVGNTGGCKDSATAIAKIYPGFTPSFNVAGSCYQTPFQFTDTSFAKYGYIDSWSWNLGDSASAADTFSIRKFSYQYTGPQNATATLAVTSSVGCSGSVSKVVTVNNKPYIHLPFTDTLICSVDSLPLNASAVGSSFLWTPNKRITNTNILNAIVYPKDTTVYTLTVTDNGCIDSAKITVNVLTFIKVTLGPDTALCKTDAVILRPVSDALSYKWRESTNANSLDNAATKYPVATPLVTTTYYVTGNLGYCQDSTKIKINVSPYPVSNAGNDTAICYGTRIQLNAKITGSSYSWAKSSSMLNANTLTPVVGPDKTASYILTVKDTFYCPKPVSDTITVVVIPRIYLNAGKDTSVNLGQRLQLAATGANPAEDHYQWNNAVYLSSDTIYNPVVTINSTTVDSVRFALKVTTPEGCSASDDLVVRVYKNGPEIYVPSGFTPNGDGLNDILKPVLVGITDFDFFAVYNRWGQPIFYSKDPGNGWNGTYKGVLQPSGAYVYMAQGKDINGNIILRKGTVVLIR